MESDDNDVTERLLAIRGIGHLNLQWFNLSLLKPDRAPGGIGVIRAVEQLYAVALVCKRRSGENYCAAEPYRTVGHAVLYGDISMLSRGVLRDGNGYKDTASGYYVSREICSVICRTRCNCVHGCRAVDVECVILSCNRK